MSAGRPGSATTWNATSCDSEMVDTSKPVPSAPSRKSVVAVSSAPQDPRIGRSKRNIAAMMMPIEDTSEIPRYGSVLPTT